MSASMPQRQEPARPSVGLHSLPLSVKKHIAFLCAAQDWALRTALDDTRGLIAARYGHDSMSPGFEEAVEGVPNNSLGMLFKVSREWSELAAPFLFETLPVAKTADERFRFLVLPRRGHLFKRLELEDVTLDRQIVVDFVVLLPQLPNLRRLALCDFHALLDRALTASERKKRSSSADRSDLALKSAKTAFAHLLEQAHTLELVDVDVQAARDVLQGVVCANLTHLQIGRDSVLCQIFTTTSQDWLKLFKATPNLRSLEVYLEGCEVPSDPDKLVNDANTNLPALEELALVCDQLSPSAIAFAECFAKSLAALLVCHQDLGESSKRGPASKTFDAVFPKLTRLKVFGTGYMSAVASVLKSSFPAVELLVCDETSHDELLDLVPEARTALPDVHIAVWNRLAARLYARPSSPSSRDAVTSPSSSKNAAKDAPEDAAKQQQDVDILGRNVSRTATFLTNWLEQAKVEKDMGALEKMADSLMSVDLERVIRQA
ncbi:hypothetical protein JCM10908_002223 [Rhodotorula pacifica]|uniref:uncharacterized protein n=1 Tax=Rhodotorula pacifica TaxID=1495444 RepID=UPI0031818C4B